MMQLFLETKESNVDSFYFTHARFGEKQVRYLRWKDFL